MIVECVLILIAGSAQQVYFFVTVAVAYCCVYYTQWTIKNVIFYF